MSSVKLSYSKKKKKKNQCTYIYLNICLCVCKEYNESSTHRALRVHLISYLFFFTISNIFVHYALSLFMVVMKSCRFSYLCYTPKVLMNSVHSSISRCLLAESQFNSSPITLTVPSTAVNALAASKKAYLVLLIKKSVAFLEYS